MKHIEDDDSGYLTCVFCQKSGLHETDAIPSFWDPKTKAEYCGIVECVCKPCCLINLTESNELRADVKLPEGIFTTEGEQYYAE